MDRALRRPFGMTPSGEQVELLHLKKGAISCNILTWGATLQALFIPNREGKETDVVLGYDSLEEYMSQDGYLGAVVGRYANRVAKGKFKLNGKEYSLAINNGPNHLHGGLVGFSHRVWQVDELAEDRAVLCLDSPDGEEGYPGHLKVKVTYTLLEQGLEIHYGAVGDADTPCNLTNHSYFNLSGQGSGSVLDQEIALSAARYTPTDETSIPTGELALVEGTPMDLRQMTKIGAHEDDMFPQLCQAKGYDHNYVIDGTSGVLRPAARAYSRQTGIRMEVKTTLPGIQLYTANYLEEGRRGKAGAQYGPRHGFCLETQFFPDSLNRPAFPSAILPAGKVYDHKTQFLFSIE